MNKKIILIALIISLCLSLGYLVYAQNKQSQFLRIDEKKELQQFIKIHERSILGETNQEDTKNAKFAVGEYYFKNNNIYNSRSLFTSFAKDYPPQTTTLLAKIFLYKIAILHGDTKTADKLRKEIFDQPFIILFSDYEILEYASSWGNKYAVHNYLDKVEVFLNGQLFEEIKP